jgi:hypothetical protein
VVDETGITKLETKRGVTKKKRILRWDELDAIKFETGHEVVDYGGDWLNATVRGAEVGAKAAEYAIADRAESDVDPVFHAPSYLIRLQCHGKDLDFSAGTRVRCDWLAQAIEYYAPIDLTWFGDEVRPDEGRVPDDGVTARTG